MICTAIKRLLFFTCISSVLWQKSFSQSISGEQNYAMNSPGVVMVQAVFSATVYVNDVQINEERFDKLVDSVKNLDKSGSILSPGQKLDIVVKTLYKSPFRYFIAGKEYYKQVHRVVTSGTGFLITGDGCIITNSHIIDHDSAFIRNKFILSTFQEVTEQNINSLQSSWAMTLTDEQRNLLYNSYGLIYSQVSSMILYDLKREIDVLYRADGFNNNTRTIKKKAEVLVNGRPMPGKDVAILKIEDGNNLPTLMLSADSLVDIGTQALVLGYPEPANDNSFLSSESVIEPSLTAGIVSAVKESVGGWQVIQMDALISHGSSGSPVCNGRGKVIGLTTFGSLEQGSNLLASGFNFAIPLSVIKEFLDSAKIHPALSEASVIYNQGIDFFYKEYYKNALRKFNQVKKINKDYPGLNYYTQLCRNKIAAGEGHSDGMKLYYFVAIVLFVLFGAYYFLFRQRPMKQ